ncbi:MAG: hypothetical protein ACN6OP_28380, partial [Pseudomonadales bacterium]
YPVEARVQDRFAEGLLQTLIEIGPKVVHDPADYDSRANMMWAASVALNGLIGAGVPQDWSTHLVGHELTALYRIDHARTLAIVLPSMLCIRRDSKRAKLLQYAEGVWHITTGSEDERTILRSRKPAISLNDSASKPVFLTMASLQRQSMGWFSNCKCTA